VLIVQHQPKFRRSRHWLRVKPSVQLSAPQTTLPRQNCSNSAWSRAVDGMVFTHPGMAPSTTIVAMPVCQFFGIHKISLAFGSDVVLDSLRALFPSLDWVDCSPTTPPLYAWPRRPAESWPIQLRWTRIGVPQNARRGVRTCWY
jgi:hypothetical protein